MTHSVAPCAGTSLEVQQPELASLSAGILFDQPADLELAAAHAVVAVPPPMPAAIEHQPPLPLTRRVFEHETPLGRVIKVQATYDEPFWRRYGLSGQLLSDRGRSG